MNLLKNLWPIILAIYIISPLDAHPLLLDDLIAAVVMFYIIYKNSKQKKQQQEYNTYGRAQSYNKSQQRAGSADKGPLTLDEAYKLLDTKTNASWDEISRAYKEKMTKSHPDKVSHLSEELQEKAKEVTLKLNEAYDLIKKYKKGK